MLLLKQSRPNDFHGMERVIKKQVQWGAVSILEFNVGYNASAVPESGGPPVGLIGRPTCHSYWMLPVEEDDEVTDSEDDSVDVESETEVAREASLSLSCSRRCNELWLDPMQRAQILAENQAFAIDDIALICRDVRATLDSRAFSRWDEVTKKAAPRQEVTLLRCGGVYSSSREKVSLY